MNLNEKTKVLIEALPYIKRYSNKIVVIKFGGNAMPEIEHVIADVVLLKHIGIKPVVVHGGGPDIDKELKKSRIQFKFINGLRYTDEASIKVIEKVFSRINRSIVSSIKAHGAKSVKANVIIKAKQKSKALGLVGKITGIDEGEIIKIMNSNCIPVMSPIGVGDNGEKYNINADTAAAYSAVALGAEKLTILTNVDGIMIGGKLLPHLDFGTAINEIRKGAINKGMVPKVEACIYAVKNKCPKAHLINGLIPHSLLLEIFTDKGVGTEIVYKNGYKGNN